MGSDNEPPGRVLAELDLILTAATNLATRVTALETAGAPAAADRLTAGQETIARTLAITTVTQTTQVLRLVYFTARKSETSTQTRVRTGGTAAGATPTVCRWGLYTIAANGDGTLVASIANDTALFAATSTAYTRSWTTPYAMVAGQRYAFGSLVVTAAAAPILVGSTIDSAEGLVAATLSGVITAQSDLPSSFLNASVTAGSGRVYAAILP